MDVREILTLEDQCFLHLICHLEDYLPETLALLPLHLRHRLLLNLPMADICQLENTAVSSGIDMEGSIWKVLDKKYAPLTAFWFWRYRRHNQQLLNQIFDVMWWSPVRAKYQLFTVKGCLELSLNTLLSTHHHFAPFGIDVDDGQFIHLIPYRHVKWFSVEIKGVDLFRFLVNKCKWMPLELTVNTLRLTNYHWKEHDSCTALMHQFLSRLQNLSLTLHPNSGSIQVLTIFVQEVLANPQVALRGLEVQRITSDTMATVASFFSPASGSRDPLPFHLNIPYSGLSSIYLSIDVMDDQMDSHLQALICYQKSLTTVHLCSCRYLYTPSVALLSSLGALFHQPQFRGLTMDAMVMYHDQLNALLPPFLSAPSMEHEKALTLVHVNVISAPMGNVLALDDGSPVNMDSSCSRLHPAHKRLNLIRCFQSSDDAFHLLFAYRYISLLSSLTVEHWSNLLTCNIPRHSRVATLPHLQLVQISLDSDTSDKVFTNVFQCPHLKTVHMINCDIGPVGLLPALTKGLQKQISVGSLEDLSLEGNGLGTLPDQELQEFFDVLFSLPQLSNLEVDLSTNDFRPDHFSLMHTSWMKSCAQSGRVLKVLTIRDRRRGEYYLKCAQSRLLSQLSLGLEIIWQ